MPIYYNLKSKKRFSDDERRRVSRNLIALKRLLRSKLPGRTVNDTLLLATWNIREFGGSKYGGRIKEAYYYIAEIISAFDIVAIQEVKENLRALEKVMYILGENWRYISTDVTAGKSGFQERLAFVYDSNKIGFQNIAGEIVLPMGKKIKVKKGKEEQEIAEDRQFARTPYIAAFQCGWLRFMLCTAHIYYGAASGVKLKRRIDEIRALAKFLSRQAGKEFKKKSRGYNYILLGDFNINDPEDETMKALQNNGFEIPEKLQIPTNVKKNKFYDQIAFKTREGELRIGGSEKSAGVLDYFRTIFKAGDVDVYEEYMKKADEEYSTYDDAKKGKLFEEWRTYQMSDHYPLWVELKIDFSEDYLKALAE